MSRALSPAVRDPHVRLAPAYDDIASIIDADDEPRLSEYRDILIDHRWQIVAGVVLALLVGLGYVILATPVYRANVLVQIEDSAPESKSFLSETSGLFEVKTPATGEIQVLGSRTVLGAAIDQVQGQVNAQPRYLPLVGGWLSRRAKALSDPGFMHWPGFVTGTERIDVARFDVPASLEDTEPFIVTALGEGRYTVRHDLFDAPLEGTVGEPLQYALADGVLNIQLRQLAAKPGAEFEVVVASRQRAIEQLQGRLQLAEQGRQSNVISLTLEDSDRGRLVRVLNAIGEQYVRQNMERKSAEAEKTLAFLDAQLPQFQRQLEVSEDAFARFRNQRGTVAFDEEAKVWLKRSTDLEASLLELQQRRRDLAARFTDESLQMQTLDKQIQAVQSDIGALSGRLSGMPNVQRDALRLERDVRVNSALYQSLQNNALQLRLVKEGKIGNVRVLDRAFASKQPVKPQKGLVLAFCAVLGMILMAGMVVVRARSRAGVRHPEAIAMHTGLNVYAVVPYSPLEKRLERDRTSQAAPTPLLVDAHPGSEPIEALRSLRVGLRVALAEASNNRVLITGATPGIGKSFIASNFAALVAQAGRRVLLINADLRKGSLNDVFGLERDGGLSELLAGQLSAQAAIRSNVRPHLDVLTTGKLPALPADLLESDAFVNALQALSPRYDLVLIDTAPVLVAADAAAVAPHCGVVLLVARADLSQLGEVNESIRRLAQAGAPVSGVLFNGMDLRRRYAGGHGYRPGGYRYSEYGYSA